MSEPAGGDWRERLRHARAVLFDFDGTLAPNLDLPELRRRVVALVLSREVPESVFAGQYIVEVLEVSAAWLRRHDPVAADALHHDGHRLIRDFEIEAARRTEPFPDTRPVLDTLRRHGKGLAVVTRNCRGAVLAVFPDVEDYCHHLFARDDVAHLKPDARHVEQALYALGHPASAGVMVGDGQLDMRMGRDLGLYCIGVESGSSDHRRLLHGGADAVLPGIDHLLQAFG